MGAISRDFAEPARGGKRVLALPAYRQLVPRALGGGRTRAGADAHHACNLRQEAHLQAGLARAHHSPAGCGQHAHEGETGGHM